MEDLLIRDEHIANQIGVIEEEEMLRSDLVVSDVAILIREMLKEEDWISRAELAKCKPDEICAEAGWEPVLRSAAAVADVISG